MSTGLTEEALVLVNDFRVSAEERLRAAETLAVSFKPDMVTVCQIDLHCHSFYSDGYYSPSNKVFEAYRRGMRAISITDHDVFDGQPEALCAGDIFGIEVIPGIEFYTDRPGVEIIAHFPDIGAFCRLLDSSAADLVVEPIRKAKKKQLETMTAKIPGCFGKLGLDAEITPQDIDSFLRNGMTTKGDISVVMWQKYGCELRNAGLASDVKDFQARYTTRDDQLNEPLDLDMDLSAESFVRRVLEWGGLPGLSHPTELRAKEHLGNEALRELVWHLASTGLQGIEVDGWRNGVCPETGMLQTNLFEGIRLGYNDSLSSAKAQDIRISDSLTIPALPLLFTNGSDDHNQPGEGLELGCGKDKNLRAEFGTLENIGILRGRARHLATFRTASPGQNAQA
ncbi:MAG: PHP domain-containing protein [Victivallales bacterium]|nr:PHP domain-containing protein [Victivallales bacterium]